VDKISRLQRFKSKVLNVSIVKFFKAVIRAKDDAFVMYLIKKNLLATIVDIFIENENKGNLLHSCILELFDYLTKETNKKIAMNFIQTYSSQLFKNPLYEKYFKNFLYHYEGKLGSCSTLTGSQSLYNSSLAPSKNAGLYQDSGSNAPKPMTRPSMLPKKRFPDSDEDDSDEEGIGKLINKRVRHNSSSSSDEDDEEDEKYNQEMFKKRQAELLSGGTPTPSIL
jgi:hypothetical protein